MKTNRDYHYLFAICLTIFLAGLIIYFYNFNGGYADQSTFSAFGGFLSPFLTSVSIILLSYIAYKANKISETYNQIQLQPLLYLNFQKCRPNEEQLVWVINNGFDAPAINILIRFNFSEDHAVVTTKWVNCFSLNRSTTKTIEWMSFPDVIEMVWTDITNERCFKMRAENWISKTTNIDKAAYDKILQNAWQKREIVIEDASKNLSSTNKSAPNISDLISRSFTNYFTEERKAQFDKPTYIKFLEREGLICTDSKIEST